MKFRHHVTPYPPRKKPARTQKVLRYPVSISYKRQSLGQHCNPKYSTESLGLALTEGRILPPRTPRPLFLQALLRDVPHQHGPVSLLLSPQDLMNLGLPGPRPRYRLGTPSARACSLHEPLHPVKEKGGSNSSVPSTQPVSWHFLHVFQLLVNSLPYSPCPNSPAAPCEQNKHCIKSKSPTL